MSPSEFPLRFVLQVQNEMGAGVGQATGQLNQLGNAVQQADRQTGSLEARTASTGEQFTRLALGIGSAASGVLNLVRQYTGLAAAQARLTTMAGREITANLRLNTARENLTAITEEYGANSTEAAEATEKLRAAELAASGAAQRHDVAQTNLNQRIADFAISIVPSAISVIAGLVQTFDILRRATQTAGQASLTSTIENTMATVQSTAATLNATSATEIDTAATLEGVGAQLESTGATAQNTAAQISNTSALNANVAATARSIGPTNALAAAQTRAGLAAQGMGLKMKIALIGTGIGAALVALGGFLLAFSHNWFGVRDAINAAGKALGDMFPWLQGLLNMLKEAGIWMSRLFGVGIPEGMGLSAEGLETFGESASKARDRIKELAKASADFVLNLAGLDKKEKTNTLFDLGIKGGMEKRFKGVLKDIDELTERMTGFHGALQVMENIDVWEKFGLKDIPSIKKMLFTWEDRFREEAKKFGKGSLGKEIFKGLEETMETAARDPGNAHKIIGNYLMNNSEIIGYLEDLGYTDLANTLKGKLDKAIQTAFPDTVVEIDPNTLGQDVMKKLGITEGSKPTNPFQAIIDQANNLVTTLKGMGFADVGATWQKGLIDPIVGGLSVLPSSFQAWAAQAHESFKTGWGTVQTWVTNFTNWLDNTFPGVLPTVQAWGTAIAANFMLGIAMFTELGNLLYKWIDAHTNGQLTSFVETGKKIGKSLWEGITQAKPSVDFASTGLILGGQAAFGDTGSSLSGDFNQTNITNQIIQEPPDTSVWTNWGSVVEKEIGEVWIKATAFVNYIHNSFTSTIPIALQASQTAFANLANQGANSLSILANASSKAMSGFANNLLVGEVAAQDLQTGIANLANQGTNSLSSLAKASSKQMNGFANNMKVGVKAVDSLKDAINSLKSKTVTVSVKVSNSKAEGGIMSFAEGGAMSAAAGKFFTTKGPQQVLVGDNPGGRETVAFIPHNDPDPTLDKIYRMFGYSRLNLSGGNASVSTGSSSKPPTIVVYNYLDGEQIRGKLVRTLAKNQSVFK